MNKFKLNNLQKMISLKMSKKGGASLSIALLVIATLAISFFSIYSFSNKTNSFNEEVVSSYEIYGAYSKEYILNYHVQDIMNEISRGTSNEEEIIARFKFLLINYRDDSGKYYVEGFEQIEEQLIIDNVKIGDGFAKLSLRFNLEYGKGIIQEYNFNKEYFGRI